MTLTARVACGMAAAVWLGGCAPTLVGAHQVGGAEPSTWIYVDTSQAAENGVYRCHDEGARIRCIKARVETSP